MFSETGLPTLRGKMLTEVSEKATVLGSRTLIPPFINTALPRSYATGTGGDERGVRRVLRVLVCVQQRQEPRRAGLSGPERTTA